ncbi:hypothetical protein PYW07_010536 [Mythimna separata]|uniref:Gloverin n=1 Tax=Mythimna separata TaxID=271217 RepID=A0AAD7YA40_MYTSE|nr:hypothetical protein PYW07_010536 [Mythimna separata]
MDHKGSSRISPLVSRYREFTSDIGASINGRLGIEQGTVYDRSLCSQETTSSFNKITMQSLLLFCITALVACAHATVYYRPPPPAIAVGHPDADLYYYPNPHHRYARDLNWHRNAAGGQIFGTLGSTDDSLYGRGGYRHDIFNNRHGRLQGEGYGTRVLGAGGDSSILGGKLNWNNANENVRAGVDIQKEIGGHSNMRLTGDGVWKLDHNTRFVAGGKVQKQFGHHRPGVGIQGAIEHDF